MISLSVVIITFNEQHNIRRCLESVRSIADEILVVDSFSTDDTENICREFNVKFVQHAFGGHIEQKNWAITQAKFPHVLSIDADEALDEQLQKEILRLKSNWNADGYKMNRLTNYCGKWIRHCGWYPDTKLRLWDSRKGMWKGTNPHDRYEMIEDSKVEHLPGDILHYSYYTVEEHWKQLEYFSTVSAKAMKKEGRKSTLWDILVRPPAKFIRSWILKRGFLDGKAGFTICRLMAIETARKYKKLRQLNRG